MGLKDLLLRRAAGDNPGNLGQNADVTGKNYINQHGNLGNLGNPDNSTHSEVLATVDEDIPSQGQDPLARYLLSKVTQVTQVTELKNNGKFGNLCNSDEVIEVTTGGRSEDQAVPGSLATLVAAAGGEPSAAGRRPGGAPWKLAYVSNDIESALVADLEADGWSVLGIEEMRRYVADTIRRAEQAMAGLEDSDRGEVA